MGALFAGVLLGLMIYFNAGLSRRTSPVQASFLFYLLGSIVALVFVLCSKTRVSKISARVRRPAPAWAHWGGVPGAIAVILSNIAVTSAIGLSAAVCLMIAGQVVSSRVVDSLGWFGMQERPFKRSDLWAIVSIVFGSGIVLFLKR
jgi:transporter family-2 protein